MRCVPSPRRGGVRLPPSGVRLCRGALLAGGLALGLAGSAVAGSWALVTMLSRGRVHRVAERGGVADLELPARWLDAPRPRTAVVLGAEVYADARPSRYLRGRLELAGELYRAGLAERLLLSGAGGPGHLDEPAAMRRHLLEAGVPDAALVCDGEGVDTFATMRNAREQFGLRQALLVSQGYHLPRAVATARLLGLDAIGVGDNSLRSRSPKWVRFWAREKLAGVKLLGDLARHHVARHPFTRHPFARHHVAR